jgi:hypothetical protein
MGIDWPMLVAMIGVTIWSCFDGSRTPGMMLAASVATVAAINVLLILFSGFRPTRLLSAVWSAVLVTLFMPAWDWLSARFLYPESLWTALGMGAAFGVIRWAFMRGSSRPPL